MKLTGGKKCNTMIKPMNKPKIALLDKGETFKTLQISGDDNMFMPKHISTEEAIVILLEGSAIIEMDENEYLLRAKDSLIIPAGQVHSFLVITKLKALVIMPVDSAIKFIN